MEIYVYRTLSPNSRKHSDIYIRMVEEFYRETIKAHTKEEYDAAFFKVCHKWRSTLSNEEVQRYLFESGAMTAQDVEIIRKFYIDNAKPFQKAFLSANMQRSKRYTLVYMNDLGFPVADKIIFISASPCQISHYSDSIKLICMHEQKSKELKKYFCNCSIAIYEGWLDLKKEDTHNKMEAVNATSFVLKYPRFDSRLFIEVIEKFGKPLAEYRNFQFGVNGRTFA